MKRAAPIARALAQVARRKGGAHGQEKTGFMGVDLLVQRPRRDRWRRSRRKSLRRRRARRCERRVRRSRKRRMGSATRRGSRVRMRGVSRGAAGRGRPEIGRLKRTRGGGGMVFVFIAAMIAETIAPENGQAGRPDKRGARPSGGAWKSRLRFPGGRVPSPVSPRGEGTPPTGDRSWKN